MSRPARARRRRSLPVAIVAAMLLTLVGVASAGAAPSIEGVWSFNHGAIGIQRQPNGTYEGTVVVATRFAECTHPIGQQIWTGITEQPDGSYWGLHQWYLPGCSENPTRGPTAWRIMTQPSGSYYLRVCFSHPGTTQPEIATNGDPKEESEYPAYHVTFGCYSSELISLLPEPPGGSGPPGTSGGSGASGASGSGTAGSGVAGVKETLTLPSAKQCLSGRLFKIHLADPKYDPLKTVSVTLKGRKIATVRKGKYVIATIDLKGLPKGAFTIKINATTVLKHHLSATRTYHTCIAKIKHKKRGKKG